MKVVISFISGLIFSVGLVVAGMTNPQKVIGFLDIFGSWDMSLAFVMGGAVMFNLFTFYIIKKRKPVYNEKFEIPTNQIIDKRLVIGSALFGIGWGIAGICPGPAISNIATLESNAILFVASMLVGMLFFKYVFNRR